MKNILFYNGSLRMGGIERVMIEVLQNIDLKKYKITLVIEAELSLLNIFEKDIPKEVNLKYLIKEETLLKTINYRAKRRTNIISRIMYSYMMWRETLEKKKNIKKLSVNYYDVIIDFDMGLSKYIGMLKASKKFVWVHSSIKKWYIKNNRIKRLGNRLKEYDKIVVICDDMKKETKLLYPFLNKKIIKIYNPFNFDRIEKLAEDKSQLTDNEKKMMDEEYIVAVSRLDTVSKDYLTLFKAFKILKENNINKKLYIVGDGPNGNEIKQMVKELELKEMVKFIGLTKNPYVWIKNSILFVHSSKYEGFGLVLVEAEILGKAVIASNCKVGPSEILGEGRYGELFSVGNFEELSEKIFKVLNSDKLRMELEKKSLIRREVFNSKIIIKEYEELIDSKN